MSCRYYNRKAILNNHHPKIIKAEVRQWVIDEVIVVSSNSCRVAKSMVALYALSTIT